MDIYVDVFVHVANFNSLSPLLSPSRIPIHFPHCNQFPSPKEDLPFPDNFVCPLLAVLRCAGQSMSLLMTLVIANSFGLCPPFLAQSTTLLPFPLCQPLMNLQIYMFWSHYCIHILYIHIQDNVTST